MAEEKKSKITTIKISHETKERIDKFRAHRRETYEEIAQRILNILNLCRINPEAAKLRLNKMELGQKRARRNSIRGASFSNHSKVNRPEAQQSTKKI